MKITLIYDVELRRPACALIQAAAKADYNSLQWLFPATEWLDELTAGMRRLTGTVGEWRRVAKLKPLGGREGS